MFWVTKLPLFIAPRELLYYYSSGLRAVLSSLEFPAGANPEGGPAPNLCLRALVKGEAPDCILFYDDPVRFEYTVVLYVV